MTRPTPLDFASTDCTCLLTMPICNLPVQSAAVPHRPRAAVMLAMVLMSNAYFESAAVHH
jgi:hypothetical protein